MTISKLIQLREQLPELLSDDGWSVIVNNNIIRITYVRGRYVSTLDIKDENDYEYNSLGRELSVSKFLDKLERRITND